MFDRPTKPAFEGPDPFAEKKRWCDVAGCSRFPAVEINGVARCEFHYMQEADRARKGPFYLDAGWGSPEQKEAVQAKQELLRAQMLAPAQHSGSTPEEKQAIRKTAIKALRDYVRSL